MNGGLVESTLGDFAPALPLTPEGFSYAAAGALAGLAIIFGSRRALRRRRSEEHTSELQSLMRISYAVFCLKKKKKTPTITINDSRKLRRRRHQAEQMMN